MSNFCKCGCRNNTPYELCPLCEERAEKATITEYQRGYLAGLKAARQAVGEVVTYTDLKGPEPRIPEHNAYNRGVADGMNGRRETTLSNLTALVKEAQK